MSRHPRVLRENGHCRLTLSVKTARHPVRKSCTLSQLLSLLKREERSLWWPNQVCIHMTCTQRAAIIKNKRISIVDCPTWLTSSFHRREAADSEAAPAARHGPTETGGEGTQGRAESPWQWRMWGGRGGGGRYDRWVWGRRGQNVCFLLLWNNHLHIYLGVFTSNTPSLLPGSGWLTGRWWCGRGRGGGRQCGPECQEPFSCSTERTLAHSLPH